MERLRCVVERITYQNNENGYSVLKCKAKGFSDLVTVTGVMPEVHAGSVLNLGGFWKMDPKYGRQFNVLSFEETLPATAYGIEKYLGSGMIKGIGPKYSKKIVNQFGKDTLDIIEEEPDRLLEVSGIGPKRVERIKESWREQKEVRNIMLFLQSHDVSTGHATKIYKTYGDQSIDVVKENPYRLADDIWGIGFKTADTIASKLGFGNEKYVRLRSGLLYTLNALSDQGHCFATRDMLLKTGIEMLNVEETLLSNALDQMIKDNDVITEDFQNQEEETEKAIYLPPFYHAEKGCAERLKTIYEGVSRLRYDTRGIAERVQRRTGMKYDSVQLQAISTALSSKILILTGGPGTGKTTTTLGIISAFRESGASILLAAPTGRAAKRLSETTNMEAKTIHRLLEYKPPEGYQKNEGSPLEGDVLIVDECSMIDVMLMYALLKAVPDSMRMILVGDIDQLPSVGAGNVLRDVIDSGCFPVVRLTRIFRQAQDSRIIMNAHKVNAGKMPDLSNGMNTDFFFVDMEKQLNEEDSEADSSVIAQKAAETIRELVQTKLPKYYKMKPSDIQVLTPMQRGTAGAANLNLILQEAINPSAEFLKRGGITYRVNDKVMQIKNNYDKEVFNGDIGVIANVDLEDRTLSVRFDDREVPYDSSELDELVLAYAATIHKSQGSEYPVVVMPVLMSHFVMLQRNLIYTGITRAKKGLILVGTKKALSYAVRNVTVHKRNTLLKQRLQSVLNKAEQPPEIRNDNRSRNEWLKQDLFKRIERSKFRNSFQLKQADIQYLKEKGYREIERHAKELIAKRLAPARPENDGKQTPMRGAPNGHPVFLAQHATGTCCRGCLEKWHSIPQNKELSLEEQNYVVRVIMEWITRQYQKASKS
ncbi:MAG: ATP-dependent RecD-like DNA helicase [Erysipelotrichaceae bacterium]|nr:ATP-dependent RecD-like DNA helicase [Erysipelotrichaceae bacterium]